MWISSNPKNNYFCRNQKSYDCELGFLYRPKKPADFLHSTIDTYIADAQRENKTKLVEVWNNINQDKQEHLGMLKNCLENEVEKGELNK